MRRLSQTRQFSRDVKRMAKRDKDIAKLRKVVKRLAEELPLDPRHRDHPLIGKFINCRDCYVEPDGILIYSMDQESLRLERTGTHSDLSVSLTLTQREFPQKLSALRANLKNF